jgi:hypothetical protein
VLEPAQDDRRVGDDRVGGLENRNEILATQCPQRGAITGIDLHPVRLDALVRQGERDPLDVRRERDPVNAQAQAPSPQP